MIDRVDRLRQYRFHWPVLDTAWPLSVLRWALIVVIAVALIWLGRVVFRPPAEGRVEKATES